MIQSAFGLQFTAYNEGYRDTAYQDSGGVWTIAYGHTAGVCEGMTCTTDQGLQWLREDSAWATAAVNRLVKVQLYQNQFNALVDFVFNIGEPQFESSTMLRLLNCGDYDEAADQFTLWDLIGNERSNGLENRRVRERVLFLTPESVANG